MCIYIWAGFGRGDDTVGNPRRAQIVQFIMFNSSCSSLSSFRAQIVLIIFVSIRAFRAQISQFEHLSQQYPPPLLTSCLLASSSDSIVCYC